MRKLNDQENFWTGEFGDNYIGRNSLERLLGPYTAMWPMILRHCSSLPMTAFEMGCNIGGNLRALQNLSPAISLTAIEINAKAAKIAQETMGPHTVIHNCSILDFKCPENSFDLVFSCGVLIHQDPDCLPEIYKKLYSFSKKYILLSEYYNPTPVAIPYRNHENKLFKRDFAGEMMDMFPDLSLRAYDFIYRRDPVFSVDDCTWFLLQKN